MTDLSLIVLTWNTRELVIECLDQLERELKDATGSGGFSAEVWVVDNGSRDGTAEAIRSRFPRVRLIVLPENVGFASGNNAGLTEVNGRIVCLLNSDVLIPRGALERCIDVFDGMPNVGAAGLQLLHPDGRLQNSIHAFPGFWSELCPTALAEWLFPKRFPSKRRPIRTTTSVPAVRGAVFFVRHEIIESVGMLCEDYFFFLEETDWCWRIREAGWDVVHVPDAQAIHSSGFSSKRIDPLRTRIEFHRSLYRFVHLRRGTREAAAVRWLRVTKVIGAGLLLSFAAPFGPRFRRRFRERWGLVAWHLRGCPREAGLSAMAAHAATLDADVQKREPPESMAISRSGRRDDR